MVKVGASNYYPTALSAVTSIGTAATDGWTKLFQLDGSALPQQGTLDYCFAAWATMGSAVIPATASPVNAVMMLALGDQTAPFQDSRTWCELNFAPLRSALGQLPTVRGVPSFWVRGYTASGTNNRGAWNTTNSIAIWGRIFANGDPVSALAGCFFIASGFGIQGWSLSQFTSTEKLWSRFAPASPPRNLPHFTYTTHHQTAAGWGNGAGTWLVLSSSRFTPQAPTSTPFFQTTYSADGTSGAQVGIFGRDTLQGGSDTGQMGASARTTRSNTSGLYSLFAMGGFCVITNPASAAKLGVRGFDWFGTSGQGTFLVEQEYLAVRVDTPSAAKGLGFFQYLQFDLNLASGSNIYTGNGVTPTSYRAASWTTVGRRFTDLVQCHCLLNAANDQPSYRANIESNLGPFLVNGQPALAEGLNVWTKPVSFPEGVHSNWGIKVPNLPPTLVEWRFGAIQNLVEFTPASPYRMAGDFCAASWNWENDLNVVTFPEPTVPLPTVVVFGRESLNASALSALPYTPDSAIETEPEIPRNTFESDDLALATWPKYVVERRQWALQWSALTQTERDTLLLFFAQQGDRAFQWTPPGETTALALVLRDDPLSIDQGRGRYRVNVRAAQLVWTGP